MKLGYNRETIIGLSVLLVLTVVLVVVAVRRFVRPGVPRIVAEELRAAEVAPDENHPGEHRLKEMESHKAAFGSLDAPPAEAGRSHDYLDRYNAHPLEHHEPTAGHHEQKAEPREVKVERAPELGMALAIPPAPEADKHEHHEEAKHVKAIRDQAATVVADDRYGVPVIPAAERHDARPVVIQVSSDANDPLRHPDNHMPEHRLDAPERRADAYEKRGVNDPGRDASRAADVPGGLGNGPAHFGDNPVRLGDNADQHAREREPAAGFDNRVARRDNLPRGEMQYQQGQVPNQVPNYGGRDPHSGYEAAAAAPPINIGAGGYPGPGAGYDRDNGPRRAETQAALAQRPLRNDGMYEVQPNDSYWTISERVYGSGAYFRAFSEANRGKAARPDRLSPGLLISTPPVAQLEKDYPDFCPRPNRRQTVRNRAAGTASMASYAGGRTYVVQEGDTLSSIARNELGKVSRWAEIYQLNREALGKDYDYLTPGLRLVMPSRDSETPDRTTRRPDEPPYR